MPSSRGDVILVPFPFSDLSATKVRPAVVISSAEYGAALPDLLLAAITSRVNRPGPFDLQLEDWLAAGLLFPSALKPVIATIDPARVVHTIGRLSERDLAAVDSILRRALDL
ncbi:MAG: type II toxin-antitoxin system PemK/MazF family toxin [Anaerolinea sp.]|nr:type II toxin-antitoxin system PemK/MazF family toxin [Anaerolinea sp.]